MEGAYFLKGSNTYRNGFSYFCSVRYVIDMICHFLSSNSRHGTHSPFVYALAEQAIYRRGWSTPNLPDMTCIDVDYKPLLSRILQHLCIEKIVPLHDLSNSEQGQEKRALLAKLEQLSPMEMRKLFSQFHVLVVDRIYRNRASKRKWKMLAEAPEVTVSIDLFHFGLLFHRAEQTKEHFKLRFPYWL